ncbi:unnamed protein product [Peniophora sp. CBMAI 1063]|nr:unnamed protein product [Peniophora sp. CBMAI 1063]
MANIPIPAPANAAPLQSPPSVGTEDVPEPSGQPGPPSIGLLIDLPTPRPTTLPALPISTYPDPESLHLTRDLRRLGPALSRTRHTHPTTPQAGGGHVVPGHEAEGHELQDLAAGPGAAHAHVAETASWSFESFVRAAWVKLLGWMCLFTGQGA